MSRRKLKGAVKKLDISKKNRDVEFPGILGFLLGGEQTVEVPNRDGYVYVRLRNNLSEVIQAYNDQVSPVYNLPVVVVRDEPDRSRYRVLGRDLGVYQNWGTSSYLPRHGGQHSFAPELGGGGDIVWVYSRQFMPLLVAPSGSSGAESVLIYPSTYFQGGEWRFAGNTGTASLTSYKPTGSNARMVLVYLNSDGNPQVSAGSTYFSASLTGTSQIYPYIPSVPTTNDLPLAGVRLVSGTSLILWDNIYDLRPLIVSDGYIPTGSSIIGHTIQDDGTPFTQRTNLNFVGSDFVVYDNAGGDATVVSGTMGFASRAESQAGIVTNKAVAPNNLPLYFQNTALVTRDWDGPTGMNRGAYAVDLQLVRTSTGSVALGEFSVLFGGYDNRVNSLAGGIFGGYENKIQGYQYDYIIASNNCIISGTSVAWGNRIIGSAQSQIVLGTDSSFNNIFGGGGNKIRSVSAANWFNSNSIIGSSSSLMSGSNEFYSLGMNMVAASIIGGAANIISVRDDTITFSEYISISYSSIFGGRYNEMDADYGANENNYIFGGYKNRIYNTSYATALGTYSRVLHSGSVVWAGGYNQSYLSSTGISQFTAKFGGGYRFILDYNYSNQTPVAEVSITPSGTIRADSLLLGIPNGPTGTYIFLNRNSVVGYGQGARVYRTSGFGITGSVNTPVVFTNERWDTDNMHSGSSTQLYCNTPGVYMLSASLDFTLSVTGSRQIWFLLNGVTDICRQAINASTLTETSMNINTMYNLNVGDYVELWVHSSANGVSGSVNGNRSPEFSAQRIG